MFILNSLSSAVLKFGVSTPPDNFLIWLPLTKVTCFGHLIIKKSVSLSLDVYCVNPKFSIACTIFGSDTSTYAVLVGDSCWYLSSTLFDVADTLPLIIRFSIVKNSFNNFYFGCINVRSFNSALPMKSDNVIIYSSECFSTL